MRTAQRHTSVSFIAASTSHHHHTSYCTTSSPDPAGVEPAVQLPSQQPSHGTLDTSLAQHCRTLLQQLDAVGWDKASVSGSSSPDLKHVTLQLHDAAGRCHTAEVQLPPVGFPIAAPTVTLQLPGPFKVRWLPGDTLATLVAQIEKVRCAACCALHDTQCAAGPLFASVETGGVCPPPIYNNWPPATHAYIP